MLFILLPPGFSLSLSPFSSHFLRLDRNQKSTSFPFLTCSWTFPPGFLHTCNFHVNAQEATAAGESHTALSQVGATLVGGLDSQLDSVGCPLAFCLLLFPILYNGASKPAPLSLTIVTACHGPICSTPTDITDSQACSVWAEPSDRKFCILNCFP